MRSQNRKVNNVGSFGSVGTAGCLGLLVLGLALVNPVGMSARAFAEEDPAEVRALVMKAPELAASSVQIAFSEPVGASSLTPVSADGASALYSVRATVDVTNSGGYVVYLGSSKSELTGRNSRATINSVTSLSSYEGLPVNSWGYSYTEGETVGTTFSAMPANVRGVVLGSNDSTEIKADKKTFMLSFAAHVGNDKPADVYENEVVMSVVSLPLEVVNDFRIATMQEMTSVVCDGAADVNVDGQISAQLKDVRDGKYYWVSKLADGKCWMTQNLDLDLDGSTLPLTPATSDVGTDWTPTYNGEALYTANIVDASTILGNDLGQRSWSLGNYRIIDPTDFTMACGFGLATAAGCPDRFAPFVTPTVANNDELAHYILGNHYQWNAATAGTGGAITNGEAVGSICPKGWKLPSSIGDYLVLLGAESIDSATKLASSPFYAVAGGDISPYIDYAFESAGTNGRYWTSTPDIDGVIAYDLGFGAPDNVDATNHVSGRRLGFSVRCVAR